MTYGFNTFQSNPLVMHKTTSMSCAVLVICVDGILLIGSDEAYISATKAYSNTLYDTQLADTMIFPWD